MRLAELIFERIKHGDDQHRSWLKAKAEEIAAEYHDERGAKLERVEALLAKLELQQRALLYQGSRFQTAQALAIAGVVQQLKLVLGGEA